MGLLSFRLHQPWLAASRGHIIVTHGGGWNHPACRPWVLFCSAPASDYRVNRPGHRRPRQSHHTEDGHPCAAHRSICRQPAGAMRSGSSQSCLSDRWTEQVHPCWETRYSVQEDLPAHDGHRRISQRFGNPSLPKSRQTAR